MKPLARSAHGSFEAAAGTEARHPGRRDRDGLAGARVATAAGGATGDDERAEAADRHAAAVAKALADAAQESAEGALGGGTRAASAARQQGHEVGAIQGSGAVGDAAITRATASSNTDGPKGFSMTGTPEFSRNAHDSGLAVSPVMNTKRWARDGAARRTLS
jgi:hypothetical protein